MLMVPVGLLLLLTDAKAQMPIRDRASDRPAGTDGIPAMGQQPLLPPAKPVSRYSHQPQLVPDLSTCIRDYPNLDRRPLSPAGEQTQRLELAAAMKISSDYYKQQADTVRNMAMREMTRISGSP